MATGGQPTARDADAGLSLSHRLPLLGLHAIVTCLVLLAAQVRAHNLTCSFGHCPPNTLSTVEDDHQVYYAETQAFRPSDSPIAYFPWPIRRTKRCTHIYATHTLFEASCTLPPSCGPAVRTRVDLNWWGKEHTLCRGLEAELEFDPSGRPRFLRHGVVVPSALLFLPVPINLLGRPTLHSDLLSNLFIAKVGTQYHVIDRDSLCNILIVSPSSSIELATECMSRNAAGLDAPDQPIIDVSRLGYTFQDNFSIPVLVGDADTPVCTNVTWPTWSALRTSSGTFMASPTRHCNVSSGIHWGFRPSAVNFSHSPHFYSTAVEIPGLKWLESALAHIVDLVVAIVLELIRVILDLLAQVTTPFRIPQVLLFITAAFWFLPARRAVIATTLYTFTLGRRSSTD